jgi:Ca2+-binding RTX toxin-like protein/methionine-rich copper-binding protein CopC
LNANNGTAAMSTPILISTSPLDDATDIAVGTNLVLTFDQAVQAGTGNIVIRHSIGGGVARTIPVTDAGQISFSGNQLIINPTTDLAENHAYYITVAPTAVRDLDNNFFAGISSPSTFNFTTAGTADTTGPVLTSTSPLDDAMGVAVETNIVLTFDEAVQAGTGQIRIVDSVTGSIARLIAATDASQVTFSGNQVIINPTTDLAENHAYNISWTPDAIRDLANNNVATVPTAATFNFTTAGTADTTGPIVTAFSPADNSTGVPVDTNLVLTFNEDVQIGNFFSTITIQDTTLTFVWSIQMFDTNQITFSGNQVTIDPLVDLIEGVSYFVTIQQGAIHDLAGNPFNGISSSQTFNFSTPPDSTPPLLFDTSPDDDAIDVAPDANLSLFFNELMKAGSGNIELHRASDGSIVESFAVTDVSRVLVFGSQVQIFPGSDLDRGESYYITMGSGVVLDLANNPFAGLSSPAEFNFTIDPDEVLIGTTGSETLDGKAGDDTLDGLTGIDTLIGGPGDDTFIIAYYEGGQTSIHLESEPGDWVGQGQLYSFIDGIGEITAFAYDATGDGLVDGLEVSYDDDVHSWDLRFSTTQLGTNLVPGTYLNAERYALASPGHPGLEVTGDGRGQSFVFGSFIVDDAVFDYSGPSPTVVSLSITFEQHSEVPDAPALFGTVNVNYAPAGPPVLDTIVEHLDEGNDTVRAAVSYVLGANLENLILTGNGALYGTGNALDNVITGNAWDNALDGGPGADAMTGGGGDDTYTVDNIGDEIFENPFQGTDTVLSSVTHTLDPHVENLILTGNEAINGGGNDLANTFIGNVAANIFSGGDGSDVYFLEAGDTVIEILNGGTDSVIASFTQTLSENVENLALAGNGNIDGTGNSLDNIVIGTNQQVPGFGQNVLVSGEGNDALRGGTGFDSLIGGPGNDTYVISSYAGGETSLLFERRPDDAQPGEVWSDVPTGNQLIPALYDFTGDGFVDLIQFSDTNTQWSVIFATNPIGTNIAPGIYEGATTLVTPGHAQLDVTGFGLSLPVPQVGRFTIAEAVFDYSGPAPVLLSFSATLELGPEIAAVGTTYGTVNYNYAPAGPALPDLVIENPGEGIDTVESTLRNYTLPANVENLTLLGDQAPLNGTGNDLNNVIVGNDGDNLIDGGLGADTMIGGFGNDTYFVDDIGDNITEVSFGGPFYADTVHSSISIALGPYLENLTLTGSASISGTGNTLDNILVGNNGNNLFSGGLGLDTLTGGGGNDTFHVLSGAGSDTITDFTAGAGAGDVINLDGFALGTFGAVWAAMSQSGSNTILHLGGGQTLTFLNVSKSAFAANDFTFDLPAPSPFTLPVSGAPTNFVTGTPSNDTLNGTNANDLINGRRGKDVITGLAGDDTYVVNASADSVIEVAGNGIDTVMSSAFHTQLANNVENLALTGMITHIAVGNDLSNLIVASSRPDLINGGAGDDIIRAGTGACVLTGGTGFDMFDFPSAGMAKRITDFHVGEDLVDLRTLLSWYSGSDPVADGVIALSSVSGGVLLSVKPTAAASLQGLVTLTGLAPGDLDVGADILWT